MTLEQLNEQAQKIILQRSGLKDQLEQMDKALANISFAIQVLEANKPKQASGPVAVDSGDVELEVN